MMNNLKRSLKYLYAISVVFIFWYLVHKAMNTFTIPNPIDVIGRLFEILNADIWKHVVASMYRLLIALIITVFLGYFIGLFIGISKKLDKLISPIIYLFFPVPRIAFLPVFMILFGLKDLSKIILIIAITIFQIIVTIRDGAKEIPDNTILSAKALRLSKAQMIKHIYIPATMPKLFTSLRLALGSSMAALFFAENYATSYGMGYYIMNSWIKVDYEGMYAGIIIISFMGIILFKIVDILEGITCKWL